MPKNNNNQTPEQDKLDLAQQAIKKGERSRILFEMLLAEIGLGFENTYKEVWEGLHKVQQDYESAIKDLSMMIKLANTTKRHTPEKGEYGLPKDENYVAEILKKDMGVS